MSLLKNIDNEVFLMTCGIITFFIPFATVILTSDPDNMSLHDYLFLFSGAIMGPTGLFCIANDNTLNMKIDVVYLAYAAFIELKHIINIFNGTLQLSFFGSFFIPFFFVYFVVNCICLIVYIINYDGSFEERLARGDFNNDPMLKELIENDKIEHAKEKEYERKRIERNEARKAEKEKKKAEKEAQKKEAEEKKDQ
ncbi:hypothetical protein H8356DRAFT_1742158 [Neocallimastix lanati (nom. inval.)]|jgi:hypothetical protein|nr:hypothetical protein H8356DRAFT_1742158 [Neocallimastix sp. JGI-2020a]